MHRLMNIDPNAPAPPASLVPLGGAGYILPLCTNLMVTFLIVIRIWWETHGSSDSEVIISSRRLAHKATRNIIESAALYLVAQLIFVILFMLRHPAEGIIAVVATQLYVSFMQ